MSGKENVQFPDSPVEPYLSILNVSQAEYRSEKQMALCGSCTWFFGLIFTVQP